MVGKNRGQSVLSVNVPVINEEGRHTSRKCITQQEIYDAGIPVLADCFSEVFSLPCYIGRFFENLGFVGNAECAQQVIEDTYDFPEGMYPATKILLLACSKIYFLCVSREEMSTCVTAED